MNPEDWLTCELFDYLQENDIIDDDEDFEDWKHDRSMMLKLVKNNLDK